MSPSMSDSAGKSDIPPHRAGGGIFIVKNSSLRVSDLSISIGPDGAMASNLTVSLAMNVFPYWLEIAQEQMTAVESASAVVKEAWYGTDDRALVDAMERECRASMQTIVASAIAMDAFYAFLRRHVPLPEEMSLAWRTNRTARHKQISEILRRGIRLGPDSAIRIRNVLRELFRYRDMAVHPKAVFTSPAWYPELDVSTEWRFVAFRRHNAHALCGTTLSIIAQCVARPKPEVPELVEFCKPLPSELSSLVDAWEDRYGSLYTRDSE